MAGVTTADFIKEVRQVGNLPEAEADDVIDSTTEYCTDAGILRVATRELQTFVTPKVMMQREEYFVARKSYTISSANQKFRLPSRAVGAKLKYVSLVESGQTTEIPLKEVRASAVDETNSDGYYLEGAYIKLRSDRTSGTLYIAYYARPSKLVLTTACATITSISTLTINLSAAFPSALASGAKLDIVKATSPYEVCDSDMPYSSGTGTSAIVVTGTISTDWEAGDRLCLAEESCLVQLPQDLIPYLVQRTVVKILDGMGQKEAHARALADLREMEQLMIATISPRTENKRRVIKNLSIWGK
jgi:hypothetical protein